MTDRLQTPRFTKKYRQGMQAIDHAQYNSSASLFCTDDSLIKIHSYSELLLPLEFRHAIKLKVTSNFFSMSTLSNALSCDTDIILTRFWVHHWNHSHLFRYLLAVSSHYSSWPPCTLLLLLFLLQ